MIEDVIASYKVQIEDLNKKIDSLERYNADLRDKEGAAARLAGTIEVCIITMTAAAIVIVLAMAIW